MECCSSHTPQNSENKPGAYFCRGLSKEGNLNLNVNWASLIVGSKFTVFACFTLCLREIFQLKANQGLIFGGAI